MSNIPRNLRSRNVRCRNYYKNINSFLNNNNMNHVCSSGDSTPPPPIFRMSFPKTTRHFKKSLHKADVMMSYGRAQGTRGQNYMQPKPASRPKTKRTRVKSSVGPVGLG